jgi:hypothetical protein
MYAVGHDRVLHIYGPPATRIRRSLPDRRLIDALALPGVPRLHAAAVHEGRCWVLEQQIRGDAVACEDVERWLVPVTRQLVTIAGPAGPPLRTTGFWDDHRDDAVAVVDRRLRGAAAAAWDAVGDLPARVLHGDAQRRNVLVSPTGIGVVDWEGAWRFGLPALDILFWRLTAGTGVDAGVAEQLITGGDDATGSLRAAIHEVGVPDEAVPQAVLATLTVLALGEQRRAARAVRHREHPTPFRAALDEVGRQVR